jgi:Spy/CpxP family protein refolding chaperone
MSLKNKFFSVLAVAIGIVGFSTFTLAQDQPNTPTPEKSGRHMKGDGHGRHGRGGFGMHGGMFRMLHGLDLTDSQKTQIHSIMEANKPDQATMEEFRTLGKAKHEGTLTAEQQDRLKTLRSQQMEKMKGIHQQIIAILTPDQVAKMEQRKQEMKQRRQEWKQRRQQKPATNTDQPADQ